MVIANFCKCEKEKDISGLWQYDYGQVLRIQGLKLPTAVEIHFALQSKGGDSVTRVGVTRDGVTDVVIPDSMLENNYTSSDYSIYAFIYLTDETSGETVYKLCMRVRSRPRPEAFDAPGDADMFRDAIDRINEVAKEAYRNVQADLSENDENDPSYVKGRTHWIDDNGTVHKLDNKFLDLDWLPIRKNEVDVVLEEKTLNYNTTATTSQKQTKGFHLEDGKKYVVYWKGAPYECTAKGYVVSGNGYDAYLVVLGNAAVVGTSSTSFDVIDTSIDSGEPFGIVNMYMLESDVYDLTYFVRNETGQSEDITVKIECNNEILNTLPEKYLPSSVIKATSTAEIGQTIVVEEVDENGKPIKWKCEDVAIGGTAISNVEPTEDDIPKVFFDEAIPQTKTDTITKFRYISKTKDVSGYVEFKAQGNSSMSYPKKNVTVKMYQDEACETKLKVDFKAWGKQSKHVYKANWIDLTHARNVVSARLWGEIVKSRSEYESYPTEFKASPNQGAIDGFPIKVYSQGIYQGRYTLNIPKDAWMANMDKDLDKHCILCGENYASGCFRASANINGSDWSDEVHDVVPTSIKTRWNEVISFIMNSTDEEFKANLGNYFYIDSLIDYLLFGLVSCGLDAFGKNQIYMTYDGQKWIASMYDMDSTWGLYYNGSKLVSATYDRTEYEDYASNSPTCSGEGNLLYNRLQKAFYEEIKARYEELKHGALSIPNIINHFERFTDIASLDLVKEDYASTTGSGKFTGIPSKTTNNIQQIRDFVVNRFPYCDTYVDNLSNENGEGEEGGEDNETISCTGISLNSNSLEFTDRATKTLVATLKPTDTTDTVNWISSDTSVATVRGNANECTVTPIASGSCTITATCGTQSATCDVSVDISTNIVNITSWSDTKTYSIDSKINTVGNEYILGEGNNYAMLDPIELDYGVYSFRQADDTTYNYTTYVILDENNIVKSVSNNYSNGSEKIISLFETNGYKKVVLSAHSLYETDNDPTNQIILEKMETDWAYKYKVQASGIVSGENYVKIHLIPVEAGKQYRLKNIGDASFCYLSIIEFDENKGFIKKNGDVYNTNSVVAKMSSNTKYVIISAHPDGKATNNNPENQLSFELVNTTSNTLLYSLEEETEFNGTSDYIDTELKLFEADTDFTIMLHATADNNGDKNENQVLHCVEESASSYHGLSFGGYWSNSVYKFTFNAKDKHTAIPSNVENTEFKVIITHSNGGGYKVKTLYNSYLSEDEVVPTKEFKSIDKTLLIGCYQTMDGTKGRFWKGTVHDCKVYGYVISDDEISAYMQ